jgi:hypothetical protein
VVFVTIEDGAVIVADGGVHAVMLTAAVPEETQPLSVTVTLRSTVPLGPAVNVIAGVFAADVIVPPFAVHEYVAPPEAVGTDALLPVEFAATDAAAPIVADGIA